MSPSHGYKKPNTRPQQLKRTLTRAVMTDLRPQQRVTWVALRNGARAAASVQTQHRTSRALYNRYTLRTTMDCINKTLLLCLVHTTRPLESLGRHAIHTLSICGVFRLHYCSARKVFTRHHRQADCSTWSPNQVLYRKEGEMLQEMQGERMQWAGWCVYKDSDTLTSALLGSSCFYVTATWLDI